MSGSEGPLRIESLCEAGQDGVASRQAGLPTDVRRVHRAVLRAFLASGQPPDRDNLRLLAGIDVMEAVGRLDEVDLVHLDGAGRVAVAYPFSGAPTAHVVRLDGAAPVHAMCAIDALGILLMVDRDGVIESVDPDDGQPIRVERRNKVWRWSPAQAVVLLAQTRRCGPAADCLCPAITFHADRARAEDHLRRRAELTGLVLDQERAVEVADWSFGALLAPEPDPGAPAPVLTEERP
jgi:hypothetical protein